MKTVDTRGLSCPQPVLLVTKEVASGNDNFEVLMNSEASKENVARLLNKKGLNFDIKEENGDTIYTVKR